MTRPDGAEPLAPAYDVVIVGAGPVGLLAANLLARFGVGVLVAERNLSMYTYPRAIGIDDEALRVLQYLDLADGQLAQMQLGPTIEYLSPSGYTRFCPPSEAQEYGFPFLATFLQPALEQALRDRLAQCPSVTLRDGLEFRGYVQRDELQLQLAESGDGRVHQVSARFLLACDGGRSEVRRQAGIELSGQTQPQPWLVLDVRDTEALRDAMERERAPRSAHPMVTISLPQGLRRFECRLPDVYRHARSADEVAIPELLRPLLKTHPVEVVRAALYSRHFCHAERLRQNDIYLLGDAAHLVPPYGGQGLCSGIRDAFNLAWKLAHVLQGHGSERLLESYQVERGMHMAATIDFVKQLARRIEGDVMAEPQEPTRLGTILERRRGVKPEPRYERGFLCPQQQGGAMFPQPMVKHRGHEVLLDTVLGHDYAVVKQAQSALRAADFRTWLPERTRVIEVDSEPRAPSDDVATITSRALVEHLCVRGASFAVLRPDRYVFAYGDDSSLTQMRREFSSAV